MKHLLLLCVLMLAITGCSSYDTKDYTKAEPKLDIRHYLNGRLKAHGIIFDWSGKVSDHFVATIDGSWDDNSGTLDEHFTFNDGTTEQRVWTLQFSDDHHFTGTAGDVVGEGIGSQHGNALNMKYVLKRTMDDGDTIDLSIDDWMYLTDDGVLINRSKIYKWGIKVGEIFIAFTKEDTPQNTTLLSMTKDNSHE